MPRGQKGAIPSRPSLRTFHRFVRMWTSEGVLLLRERGEEGKQTLSLLLSVIANISLVDRRSTYIKNIRESSRRDAVSGLCCGIVTGGH